jgi:hypothetical protein
MSAVSRCWQDRNGMRIFVSTGLTGGALWMSVRRDPRTGGTRRIKAPGLPLRDTKDEAEADLQIYAAEQSWEEV